MSQIPFSNPAGNNQMTPTLPAPPTTGGIQHGTGSLHDNPFVPVNGQPPPTTPPINTGGSGLPHNVLPMAGGAGAALGTSPIPVQPQGTSGAGTSTGNTSSQNGFITNDSSYASGQNDLSKQLVDIYGKGVGGSLFSLLQSMSGTDSKILQEYIASLQPQMAKAQADTNAALGAGGVSANSSVAAIADSNLQAQETASIAGESASLTRSQEQLTAQILTGMSGDAAKEVATSGWSTFAEVMNNITGDIGNLAGGPFKYGGPQTTSKGAGSNAQIASQVSNPGEANYNGAGGTVNELGANVGAEEAPFAVGDAPIENNPSIVPFL